MIGLAVVDPAGLLSLWWLGRPWISEFRQRRRARHAEAAMRRLEEQVRELQAQLQPSKN